ISKKKGSSYAAKAELNALLSIEKILPSLEDIKKKVGTSTQVLKLNPVEEKFKTYAEDYLKDTKNKENRVEVIYKLASMLYAHHYLDECDQYFRYINNEQPNSQYCEYATYLLLDIYNLTGDYQGVGWVGTESPESTGTTASA